MNLRICRLALLSTLFLSLACDKEEEALPCLQAEVVEQYGCGMGTVLLVSNESSGSSKGGFCGTTTGSGKYIVVDNVPENLQAPGTIFTCQLKKREAEVGACLMIYNYYENHGSIVGMCKASEPAPLN